MVQTQLDETSVAVASAVTTGGDAAITAAPVRVIMSTPTESRVLDVTPALSSLIGRLPGQEFVLFNSLPLSEMTRSEIETLLAARESYKRKLFAGSLYKLELDPSLADVQPCRDAEELATGNCLLTESLKQQILAARELAQLKAHGWHRVKQATLPAIERKLAVVIGINKYKDKSIPQLEGAGADARAIRALLQGRMGYETVLVEDASKEAIVKALNTLALDAGRTDSVVIYYAGHGEFLEKTDMGYWIPSDADPDTPQSWLSNTDISRLVSLISAQQVMLISDSCYSGSLVGRDKVKVDQADGANEILSRKAVVIMSSGGNEPVSDQGKEGHSVFAWHLMKELGGIATWQPGGNLYDRLRAAVFAEFPQTPRYGASRLAGDQGHTDYLFEKRELEADAP